MGALKAVLVLDDWSRLVPAQRLEERYQLHLGQVTSLAELFAHLLSSLAALAEAADRSADCSRRLREHAFSIRRGLPVELQGLYHHLGDICNRADFAALRAQGVETVNDFCELSDTVCKAIFLNEHKLLKINEKQESLKQEVDMNRDIVNSSLLASGEPEKIEIDGSPDRERYLVRINGLPVRLTGKSFKYFAKLAWSRLNRESGWIYKEDIEAGLNQARYLYRMKHEVNSELAFAWPVVENNRLGYYRLDANPTAIYFNRDNLKEHPDWEVRSLFGAGEGPPAVSSGQVVS
jgi:hypothetical protein